MVSKTYHKVEGMCNTNARLYRYTILELRESPLITGVRHLFNFEDDEVIDPGLIPWLQTISRRLPTRPIIPRLG
jgi:hypothetical protein